MPQIILAPGESMTLSFGITTTSTGNGAGTATADYFGTPSELLVEVPEGFDPLDLVGDSGVPLDFVTVPEPTGVAALCVGILGLLIAHSASQASSKPS
ncbi:MAG: hypothetical protein AB8G23_24945 [Myxococcota bacterium]